MNARVGWVRSVLWMVICVTVLGGPVGALAVLAQGAASPAASQAAIAEADVTEVPGNDLSAAELTQPAEPTEIPLTDIPPTDVPTDVPPTQAPPTEIVPTDVPPTEAPPDPPTDVPPTAIPSTEAEPAPPTDIPATGEPPTAVPTEIVPTATETVPTEPSGATQTPTAAPRKGLTQSIGVQATTSQYVSVFIYRYVGGSRQNAGTSFNGQICFQLTDVTAGRVEYGPECTFSSSGRVDSYRALDDTHTFQLSITRNDTAYPACINHTPTQSTYHYYAINLDGGPCTSATVPPGAGNPTPTPVGPTPTPSPTPTPNPTQTLWLTTYVYSGQTQDLHSVSGNQVCLDFLDTTASTALVSNTCVTGNSFSRLVSVDTTHTHELRINPSSTADACIETTYASPTNFYYLIWIDGGPCNPNTERQIVGVSAMAYGEGYAPPAGAFCFTIRDATANIDIKSACSAGDDIAWFDIGRTVQRDHVYGISATNTTGCSLRFALEPGYVAYWTAYFCEEQPRPEITSISAACTANNRSVRFDVTVRNPLPGYELEVEALGGPIFNLQVAGSTRVPLVAGQTRYRPTVAIASQYYGRRLVVDAAIFDASNEIVGDWEVNLNGFTCTPSTPTPSPTPEPTATPTPEPTATPTPEPTATPTPEPTATPTPEPTVTPTPDPTATPTPEATQTPEPTATATPEPTSTPTPEPTATPTPEPTATATPDPTVEPTPEPSSTPTPDPTVEPTATPTPTPGSTPPPTAEPTATPQPAETGTLLLSLRTEDGGPVPGGTEVCVTGVMGTACVSAGAARLRFAAAQVPDQVLVLEVPSGTWLLTVPAVGPYAAFSDEITVIAGQRLEVDIVLGLAQEPSTPTAVPATEEPPPTSDPAVPTQDLPPTSEPDPPAQEPAATSPSSPDRGGESGLDAGSGAEGSARDGVVAIGRLPVTGQGTSDSSGFPLVLTFGLVTVLVLCAAWTWRHQRPPRGTGRAGPDA